MIRKIKKAKHIAFEMYKNKKPQPIKEGVFLITTNLTNLQIPFLFTTFADKKNNKNETIQNLHKR